MAHVVLVVLESVACFLEESLRLERTVGLIREHLLGSLRLDDDGADVLCNDIVQLPRDPRALLFDGDARVLR